MAISDVNKFDGIDESFVMDIRPPCSSFPISSCDFIKVPLLYVKVNCLIYVYKSKLQYKVTIMIQKGMKFVWFVQGVGISVKQMVLWNVTLDNISWKADNSQQLCIYTCVCIVLYIISIYKTHPPLRKFEFWILG